MNCPPALPDLARWLHQHFYRPLQEYDAGRRKLRAAIATYAACSTEEAETLLGELEREGYVRYTPEGRSVGGTAGVWILYSSPGSSPEDDVGASTRR